MSQNTSEPIKRKATGPLLITLILSGAAIIAFLFLGQACNRPAGDVADDSVDTVKVDNETASKFKDFTGKKLGKYDPAVDEYIYQNGSPAGIDLPENAGRLIAGEYSTENRVYIFLANPDSKIDTENGNWFELTNVKFKPGSADITEESMEQLQNLAAITKGFPDARFKIGGYTDNTGNREENIALSQKRADAVAAKLKELGASANSIAEAEGYGPEKPLADNSTPEGRAQNRRVSISVIAK